MDEFTFFVCMTYWERLQSLIQRIPVSVIDFESPRSVGRTPTQASSNFITNKEQGDWAEDVMFRAINEEMPDYVAIKYGKSDDLIAGDKGFTEFFQAFQNELDQVGKRPDLLVFRKLDWKPEWGYDISHRSHEEVGEYVSHAVVGLEIRSSAFLIGTYDAYMQARRKTALAEVLRLRDEILTNFKDVLAHPKRVRYAEVLKSLNETTAGAIDFKVPGWSASDELQAVNGKFKALKQELKVLQKRDYLSITPKAEDIKVVLKWVETYQVPHLYCQVFFDRVYALSFEKILAILADPDQEETTFSIERNTKNQNKTTFHIDVKAGIRLAEKVDEPSHASKRKEMGRGRLLFFVTFSGGKAYLDLTKLASLLQTVA